MASPIFRSIGRALSPRPSPKSPFPAISPRPLPSPNRFKVSPSPRLLHPLASSSLCETQVLSLGVSPSPALSFSNLSQGASWSSPSSSLDNVPAKNSSQLSGSRVKGISLVNARKNLLLYYDDVDSNTLSNDMDLEELMDIGYSKILKKNIIGKGAYGVVIRGQVEGKIRAIKIIKNSKSALENLSRERQSIGLIHPNLVHVHFVLESNEKPHSLLIMDLFGNNNLHQIISSKKVKNPHDMLRILEGVCSGLEYLHSCYCVHCDLKPKNILVASTMTSKLCDFGQLVCLLDQKDMRRTIFNTLGTDRYTAPEILLNKSLNEMADIYSLGITLWEVYHEKVPYESIESTVMMYLVAQKGMRPTPITSNSSMLPKEMENIYQECWAQSPSGRPTASEVLRDIKRMHLKCPRKLLII